MMIISEYVMNKKPFLLLSAALLTLPIGIANAGDRYSAPPAVTLSPDLASPWVLQLKKPIQARQKLRVGLTTPKAKVVRKVKKRRKKLLTTALIRQSREHNLLRNVRLTRNSCLQW